MRNKSWELIIAITVLVVVLGIVGTRKYYESFEEDVLAQCIEDLQEYQFAQTHINALNRLADLGPAARPAVPHIIRVLEDPTGCASEGCVRPRAARTLGKIGPAPGVVPALIRALDDEYGSVRLRAAEALGQLGSSAQEAIPALTTALEDEVPLRRVAAAEALWRITNRLEPAITVLQSTLKSDDAAARIRAARILGDIGPAAREALLVLKEALDKETGFDAQVIRQAIENIEKEETP